MRQLRDVMRIEDINIATKWHELGLFLFDNNTILQVIKIDHHSVEERCLKMFQAWLERTPDASWNQLITALNMIEMKTAANTISKLYQSG